MTVDETANNVAALFVSTIRSAVIPVYVGRGLALSEQKNFTEVLLQYNTVIAQEALDASQGACAVIGVAPNGRVLVQYPLKGNEKSIGHDLFTKSPQYGTYQGVQYQYPNRHADSLKVVAQRDVYVTDPQFLVQGYNGMFARLAVFVKGVNRNETFGASKCISDCDTECYDPATREKVWGVVSGILLWDSMSTIFTEGLKNYRYRVVSSSGATIIQSADQVTGAAFEGISVKEISVFNLRWRLMVEPKSRTLIPEWRDPVIAVVVVVSIVVSLMIQLILVQKKARRKLLLNILPKYALTALENGQDPSKDFECACLLFTDIINFTELCGKTPPSEVAVLLNELYTVFDQLADSHNVFKIETIGDAFVCCTGCPYPSTPENDARNLALMAISLVQAVNSFRSSNGISVEIRVGLHCGPVVGTIMGRRCPRFCLVGDTVNTSSRMESTSEAMRIHCSGTFAQVLNGCGDETLLLERRGVIPVKGKGNMETYWLRKALNEEIIFVDTVSSLVERKRDSSSPP